MIVRSATPSAVGCSEVGLIRSFRTALLAGEP